MSNWHRGPLPPGTWQWGGVVPVGEDRGPYSGFFFADFKGDHAVINPDDPALTRRLEPSEIAYWNNSLTLPIEIDGAMIPSVTGRMLGLDYLGPGEGVTYNTPVPPGFSTGLIPRDYSRHPVGCFDFAPAFPDDQLIPESEWAARLAENRRTRSGLLDLREDHYEVLKSLDQNGYGLCWAFSSTKAVMYTRILANASFLRLSAWYVAGCINRWRDRGGWGSASLEFIRNIGVPAESYCPSYKSTYENSEAKANAALHRVTEWWDGSDSPAMATKQLVSCLLMRVPCVVDLNDMSHSMCAIDIGSLNPLEIIYDNSWGDGGEKGLYRGRGARARPDGLVIPRVSIPSPV